MLHIARTILEKCPGSSMEKVKVFSALADVKIMSALVRGSLERGSQSDLTCSCIRLVNGLIKHGHFYLQKT
jgi:hypothetical protein